MTIFVDKDAQVQDSTTLAVLVYEKVQKARLSLDAKNYALLRALENEIDVERYHTETDEVDAEYVRKRASAVRHGRIPGEDVRS
jgi:hypothetical protein